MRNLLLILLMSPYTASAITSYDVDFPHSTDPAYQLLRVTIDRCETLIKIKSGDLIFFSKDRKSMNDVIKLAIERAKIGCPKH